MDVPPFNVWLGTRLVSRGDGEAELELELGPQHLNRRGVAHGGVVSALLDSALGSAVIASIPPEWWCATTSLTTQFIGGVGAGTLRAKARVLHRGRSVAFAVGEAIDSHGQIVASATGSWHLWPYRPGSAAPVSSVPGVVLQGSGQRLAVGKILAVGRNYAEHVAEMGAPPGGPPVLFLKPATAIVHDGAEIVLPPDAGAVHHEVELVAVIGRAGRSIAPQHALEHVLGFAVGLDLTLRDVQSAAKQRGEPWSLAKGFDGAAPISTVVPRESVGDGSGLAISLRVAGELRQSGNTSQMLRGVGELVAFASRWITLQPGDLIFTGTPAGVGPLRPGDTLEAEIERIGRLCVRIASGGEAD